MKTGNSEQYVTPRYAGIKVVPVLDNLLKHVTFAMVENTVYIPIPHKKFKMRKNKSKRWHKRRDEKISEYVKNYIERDGIKV